MSGQSIQLTPGTDALADCADLDIKFDDQPALRAEQQLTVPVSGKLLPVIAARNGGIRVRGAQRADVLVKVCKAAAGDASGLLDRIAASAGSDGVKVAGPEGDRWVAYLLVDAPAGAGLELQAENGPIDVRDFSGRIQATTTNGPIRLENLDGNVTARAKNGPIGFTGQRGTISLEAANGPISVRLGGTSWGDGTLNARTQNGPVQVKLPDGYRSGVRIQSSFHAPWSCSHCEQGRKGWDADTRTVEFGDSKPLVRVSTVNGPVQVSVPGE
jgi:hypothetical protein